MDAVAVRSASRNGVFARRLSHRSACDRAKFWLDDGRTTSRVGRCVPSIAESVGADSRVLRLKSAVKALESAFAAKFFFRQRIDVHDRLFTPINASFRFTTRINRRHARLRMTCEKLLFHRHFCVVVNFCACCVAIIFVAFTMLRPTTRVRSHKDSATARIAEN